MARPRYYGVKELKLCARKELITPNPRAVVRDDELIDRTGRPSYVI